MKKCTLLSISILLLSMPSVAQKQFSNVDRVGEAIEHKIHEAMEGWECHEIQPLSFNNPTVTDEVKIQQWEARRHYVRVVIQKYRSAEDASSDLRQFAAYKKARSPIPSLGDEAYLHGIEGAIVFRKGNLLIYISAVVVKGGSDTDNGNPNAPAQSNHDVAAIVTRNFAHHIAAVLDTF